MTDIDTSLVTHVVFNDEDGDTYEIKVRPKRMPWARIAHQEVRDLIVSGAMPGASSVGGYRTQASARLRDGSVVDVTERLLRDGWSSWIEVDRFSPYHVEQSTPERDARIAAGTAANEAGYATTEVYEAACEAEDAAMARVVASWREPVVEQESVEAIAGVVAPVAAEPAVRSVVEAEESLPATSAPVPANDTIDYAVVLQRTRAVRDTAEAEERRAMEALLQAQEVRRLAQSDLDEVRATAELYSAPTVVEADADWDPHLGPDADEEVAEAEAHKVFVATLNGLEADDGLTVACAATDAAEARLWSEVSRIEFQVGAEDASGLGDACRVLWEAHQAERIASDVYDRAYEGRVKLAA